MKIQVTQEDIDNGKPDNGTSCPIAKALKRHGFLVPYVFSDYFTYQINNLPYEFFEGIDLPRSCSTFVDKFDKGKKVSPFTFTIKVKP